MTKYLQQPDFYELQCCHEYECVSWEQGSSLKDGRYCKAGFRCVKCNEETYFELNGWPKGITKEIEIATFIECFNGRDE